MIWKFAAILLFPALSHAQYFCNSFAISAYVDNEDHRAVQWTQVNCPSYNWNLDFELSRGKVRPILHFLNPGWDIEMETLLKFTTLDFNAVDANGRSFLLLTVDRNRLDGFEKALSAPTTIVTGTYQPEGLSLLEILIARKKADFFKALLQRQDLNVNVGSHSRRPPVIQVIRQGDTALLALLLTRADLQLADLRSVELSPLLEALQRANFDLAKMLMDDSRVPVEGALQFAIQQKRDDVFWNLAAHPRIQVNTPEVGPTLLALAVSYDRYDIALALMDRFNIDPNIHKSGHRHLISDTLRNSCIAKVKTPLLVNLVSRTNLEYPESLSPEWVVNSLCTASTFELFATNKRIRQVADAAWMSSVFGDWLRSHTRDEKNLIAVWRSTGLRLTDKNLQTGYLEDLIKKNLYVDITKAILDFILDQDIDVNRPNSSGESPLWQLASYSSFRPEYRLIAETLLARPEIDPNQHMKVDCGQKVCDRSLWGEAVANGNFAFAKLLQSHARFDIAKTGSMVGVFDRAAYSNDKDVIDLILDRPDLDWGKDLTEDWGSILRFAFWNFPQDPLFMRLWQDKRVSRSNFFADDNWGYLDHAICNGSAALTRDFLDQLQKQKKNPVAQKEAESRSPLEAAIACQKDDIFSELLKRDLGYLGLQTIRKWSTSEEFVSSPYLTALKAVAEKNEAKWLRVFLQNGYDAEIGLEVMGRDSSTGGSTPVTAFAWALTADQVLAKKILGMKNFSLQSEHDQKLFEGLLHKDDLGLVKTALINKKVSLVLVKQWIHARDLQPEAMRLLLAVPGLDLTPESVYESLILINAIENYPADVVELVFRIRGLTVAMAPNQNAFTEAMSKDRVDWAKRIVAHRTFDPTIGLRWGAIAEMSNPVWIQILASHPKANLADLNNEDALRALVRNGAHAIVIKVIQNYQGWELKWILDELFAGEHSEAEATALVQAALQSKYSPGFKILVDGAFTRLATKYPHLAAKVQSQTDDPEVLARLFDRALDAYVAQPTQDLKDVLAGLLKRKVLAMRDDRRAVLSSLVTYRLYDLATFVLKDRGSDLNDEIYVVSIDSILGLQDLTANDQAWVDRFLATLTSWSGLRRAVNLDDYAAKHDRKDWMEKLIEKDERLFQNDDFFKDAGPLHYSATRGWTDLILRVIAKGEKINRAAGPWQMTALHYAVRAHQVESVRTLLTIPEVNPDLRDHMGRTPLDWARLLKDQAIIDLLTLH